MPCPDLGTLRVSLDDEGPAPARLRDHVQACASCTDTLAELRRNAELAAPAIAMTGPDGAPDAAAVEAALARLEQRRARLLTARAATAAGDPPAAVAALPARGRLLPLGARARGVAAALVAAVLLAALVATPGGRAAAAGFLAHFRSERFQVVSLDRNQSMQVSAVLSELVASGVFTGDQRELDHLAAPAVVPDLTEASRLAGFPVRTVDPSALPAGVRATPERVLVSHAQTARITFDRDKAIAYLRQGGQAQATIPRRFDGTQLVVQVPAIVVQQYAGRDGAPRLLVAKAGTLGVDAVGGASLAELRELVLRLPGLPAKAVAQLRAVGDWRTTLPLPVPSDQLRWQRASVGGAEALAFADSAGRLHALLWRRGGYIWGVAGAVGAAEALDVANSLD